MSGPNSRGQLPTGDPDPGRGRQHYHVRADLHVSFAPGSFDTKGAVVAASIDPDFKPRVSIRDWNGQETLLFGNGTRRSRAQFTALDTGGEFIELIPEDEEWPV